MLEYLALIAVDLGIDPCGKASQPGTDDKDGWFGHDVLLFIE